MSLPNKKWIKWSRASNASRTCALWKSGGCDVLVWPLPLRVCCELNPRYPPSVESWEWPILRLVQMTWSTTLIIFRPFIAHTKSLGTNNITKYIAHLSKSRERDHRDPKPFPNYRRFSDQSGESQRQVYTDPPQPSTNAVIIGRKEAIWVL